MRVLLSVIATIGLSGCSQIGWTKPGATQADFDFQKAQCEYQANLATPDNTLIAKSGDAIAQGIANGMRIGNLEQMCLRANGWSATTTIGGAEGTYTSAPGMSGSMRDLCVAACGGSNTCEANRC